MRAISAVHVEALTAGAEAHGERFAFAIAAIAAWISAGSVGHASTMADRSVLHWKRTGSTEGETSPALVFSLRGRCGLLHFGSLCPGSNPGGVVNEKAAAIRVCGFLLFHVPTRTAFAQQ